MNVIIAYLYVSKYVFSFSFDIHWIQSTYIQQCKYVYVNVYIYVNLYSLMHFFNFTYAYIYI